MQTEIPAPLLAGQSSILHNVSEPATILVVNDITTNLILTESLESAGHRVLAVLSGEAAISAAIEAQPELILLEVMMPAMDGIEVCRRLQAEPATVGIPVIFITANREMRLLTAGFAAGGVDYVAKPFNVEEVLARVSTHLRLRRLTLDLEKANAALRAEMYRRHQADEKLRIADDIRELKSTLERAMIYADEGIVFAPQGIRASESFGPSSASPHIDLPFNLSDALHVLYERALQATHGNISAAARLLGVHRTRIYRWSHSRHTASVDP